MHGDMDCNMTGGPQPLERARRLQLAFEIAEQVHQHYRDDVLALGVYGSTARGSDGPFSDIEMHCVLHGRDYETAHEWSTGPWKAEVDVYTEDVLLRHASAVDVDWPLTHGAYTQVLAIYDPSDFFTRLRIVVLSHPDRVFQRAIQMVIVGELYERLGKIRNAVASHNSNLPFLAVELAKFGACLIGLANRHLYSSSARVFDESLAIPHRPTGYDTLCRMVMGGHLADPAQIIGASNDFWSGVEIWSVEHGITIEEPLPMLLLREPPRYRPQSQRDKAIAYVRNNGDQLDRLRLRRALGEAYSLAEAEALLAPHQSAKGGFDYDVLSDSTLRTGSLSGTVHFLRWLREFDLGGRSQMVRTLDFLASIQNPDGSFYESPENVGQSLQERLAHDSLVDRFYYTAAVPMRLFSLGYTEHPMIQAALKWLRHHWSDWTLVTGTRRGLWALLCLSRAPVGLSGSQYQRLYASALEWLTHLDARPLAWLLDALQGAGFSREEPLVGEALLRLMSLQREDGTWLDHRSPVETTITALRLLRDYSRMASE